MSVKRKENESEHQLLGNWQHQHNETERAPPWKDSNEIHESKEAQHVANAARCRKASRLLRSVAHPLFLSRVQAGVSEC
jgi:hypothetical protein